MSPEYDHSGIPVRIKCTDAKYHRRSGSVHAGLYGTIPYINFYGRWIFDLQYYVIRCGSIYFLLCHGINDSPSDTKYFVYTCNDDRSNDSESLRCGHVCQDTRSGSLSVGRFYADSGNDWYAGTWNRRDGAAAIQYGIGLERSGIHSGSGILVIYRGGICDSCVKKC